MDARVTKHFLRRLRHRAEADALDYAVESGILAESFATVDGKKVRRFAPGPAVANRSERDILRLLQRPAGGQKPNHPRDDEEVLLNFQDVTKATADDRGRGFEADADDALSERLRLPNLNWLLRAVRQSANPLRATEVATLLLLTKAIAESGLTLADVIGALEAPSPIVTIEVPVDGFEDAFLDLLAGGLVLPGRVAVCNGYDLAPTYGFRFHRAHDPRWQIISFEGGRANGDSEQRIERQLGMAAKSHYPILAITEGEKMPPDHLRLAADLTLACGPIDMEIIHETMRAVLGEVSEGGISCRHTSALHLNDLALAIRPGMSVGRALDLLDDLGRMRRRSADGDKEETGSGDKDSNRRTSGWSKATKSARGNPGSGSEIIRPARLTGADQNRFVPRVETLTGYGDAKDWALALKDDLTLWRSGELAWEDMSVKLLLSGPPGTGKTTFAKALCNTLQVPLIASSVASWLEPGYLGDVLKRMSAAFAEAEAAKPCILFIDEFDGIGRRGQSREWDEYWSSVVNRALELLDGATKSDGVIVVGATNNPSAIDPALLRSGRLEKHIVIPRPNTEALMGILRHHLKNDLDAVVASAPLQLARSAEASEGIQATDAGSADLSGSPQTGLRSLARSTGGDRHGDV